MGLGGNGEANHRNSAEWGNGVYRSKDGGGTWQKIGLKEQRTAGAIRKRLVPTGDYTEELTFGKTKVQQRFHVNVPEGVRTR